MTVYFGIKHPTLGLYREAAEAFQYPGGEWDLRNVPGPEHTPHGSLWIARLYGADPTELVQAALFAEVAHQRQQPFVLMLPYLPAARSDRPMDGRPVGAQAYSSLVHSMNPQQIITIDPHSERAQMYYQIKLTSLPAAPLVRRALTDGLDDTPYTYVIAPDQGAIERAYEVGENLCLHVIECTKHRDTATGKITDIEVPKDIDPEDYGDRARYLVVDDICDGGGTFMGLAAALALPREKLGLWVTHGIFSGKAIQLRTAYADIYTTDSHPGHNRVGVATTVVPTETYLFDNI